MLEFEEILHSVKANSDSTSDREAKIEKKTSGRDLYFRDLCEFFDLQNPLFPDDPSQRIFKCVNRGMPIDFTWELVTNTFRLDQFDSDADLVARINTGRHQASFSYIQLENFYAETVPAEIAQDSTTGQNDVQKAKAVTFQLFTKGER